jgi:Ca2+-binding RTX toxin-like protein
MPSSARRLALATAIAGLTALSLTSAAHAAFIAGTPGNDTRFGTAAADQIIGLAGNDLLAGRGGADQVHGQAGNDRLYGDAAPGVPGNDLLTGGSGDDYLNGMQGHDDLRGGPGNDVLFTRNDGRARDTINCGPGYDRVQRDPSDVFINEDGAIVPPYAAGCELIQTAS